MPAQEAGSLLDATDWLETGEIFYYGLRRVRRVYLSVSSSAEAS
jgi:hypothetical protein